MTSRNSAALVGVFVSVTTVPAAGYVAVGLVLGELAQVWGSAIQLLVNLVGIVAAASMLVVRSWARQRYWRKGVTTRRTGGAAPPSVADSPSG